MSEFARNRCSRSLGIGVHVQSESVFTFNRNMQMICYMATHNDSGRHYVGITKRGLKTRRSQHERDAKNKPFAGPFHDALRKYGKDAFTWKVVAEG